MTTSEILWAIGAIFVTILTASYGKELRIILDKIPQGFRAVRIALLRAKLWKHSQNRNDALLTYISASLDILWLSIIYCGIAGIWWNNTNNPKIKHLIQLQISGVMLANALTMMVTSARMNMFKDIIIRRTRAKLRKYGIDDSADTKKTAE
jgi:hypothetical protein